MDQSAKKKDNRRRDLVLAGYESPVKFKVLWCMKEPIYTYFLQQAEPTRACLLALHDIILRHDDRITEAWKYRMPFYCFHERMLCYLWVDKKLSFPYLGIVDGAKIEHPDLISGARARMKILMINPNADLPLKAIHYILTRAISLRCKD